MEVALIPPASMVWTAGNMTRYHMVIPEGMKEIEYRNYYRNAIGYKMLDNGAAEGHQMGPEVLLDMARGMRVNEVVVPDVMFDGPKTIEKVAEFSYYAHGPLGLGFKYMAVCQGATPEHFDECMKFLLRMDWINTIAFPRCMQDIQRGGGWTARVAAITHWRDEILKAGKEIHCLGSTRDLIEVKKLSEIAGVRGIDTCAPISEGLKLRHIYDHNGEYSGRVNPYFTQGFQTEITREQNATVVQNCNTYLEWAQHGEQYNPFGDDGEATPPASPM